MFEAVDGTRMTSEANPDDITLMMLWDFANVWSFVRSLVKHITWYFRFFTITDSSRMLGSLEMSGCVVKELEPWPRRSDKCTLFWNGQSDIERARRANTQRITQLILGNPAQPTGLHSY